MADQVPRGFSDDELIFDWNREGDCAHRFPRGFTILDETLRDGLQNPSVVDPPVHRKIELLHLMNALEIHSADLGLPGSSQRAFDDVLRLTCELRDAKLGIRGAAAARTVLSDVVPIIEIAQRSGVELEAYVFIGSSPIRQLVESWDVESLSKRAADAVSAVAREGLPVAFVTEDTTRSRPDVLDTLYRVAIDNGAGRICLADTVGHITPNGVEALMRHARGALDSAGAQHIPIDWHGHNDRGLALANALRALECGASCVHGTALGIGERVGNTPMELLLVNLRLLGAIKQDLSRLVEYCERAGEMVGWTTPPNYPVVGRDAFRTATGVHAAAIIKAQAKGDAALADRVYSGVPAGMLGRRQEIDIGYMSGASNVAYWLSQRGIEPAEGLVEEVLAAAKTSDHILTDPEVMALVAKWRARGAGKDPSL